MFAVLPVFPLRPSASPLSYHIANLHCCAVVRQVPIKSGGSVFVENNDVVVEPRRSDLSVKVRLLDLDDRTFTRSDELRSDRHAKIIAVPVDAAVTVT